MLNTIRGLFLILAVAPLAFGDVIVANVGSPFGTVVQNAAQAELAAGIKSPSRLTEVTTVTLLLEPLEGAPNVTLTLHEEETGVLSLLGWPGAQIAVLGTQVVPPGINTVTFTPAAPVALKPSTDYYLVLKCNNCVEAGGGPNVVNSWQVSNPAVLKGLPGATVAPPAFYSTDGGASWYQATEGTPIFTVNGFAAARTVDSGFQVRYASNLTHGDSVVNITNTGANGSSLFGPGFGKAAGNICVNVYAFSPDEQLISCCSCLVTPNGLVHLTANNDLVSNTLTGIRPDSIVIKLIATATGSEEAPPPPSDMCQVASDTPGIPTFDGSTCANSAALAGTDEHQVAGGMLAWGTTLHSASSVDPNPAGPFSITESPFVPAHLSKDELKSIRNRCANIIGNGSTFGQCRSCRLGGLGGTKL